MLILSLRLGAREHTKGHTSMRSGFTIVELLIVVVVIAILVAITIVSYNGITGTAKESVLKANLSTVAKKLSMSKVEAGSFPNPTSRPSYLAGLTYNLTSSGFCLSSVVDGAYFHVTESGAVQSGVCPPGPFISGNDIQTATTANCPSTRTLAVDARDGHTYWIKKMADGKCWMLTNLAYAGGGSSMYGDSKSLSKGSNAELVTSSEAKYYVHSAANPTSGASQPSISTDGTNPQYGYHYNWCGAMGAQLSTSACSNLATPLPNTAVSICPSGWRLPTGAPTTGEFQLMTNSISASGADAVSAANLRAGWLSQLAGYWAEGFDAYEIDGNYWSSTQASAAKTHILYMNETGVYLNLSVNKYSGFSVRCIAAN